MLSAAAAEMRVALVSRTVFYVPLWIAHQKGFFKQEGIDTTLEIYQLARQVGLKPGEYEVVAVGGAPTRWKLLQEGRIDAGLQPFPLSYEAEAAGFTNLGPISRFVPDYLFTSVH
jgi:ABC-type nitrate/sulfonate/bicarbonate transport system substrate-binding protein